MGNILVIGHRPPDAETTGRIEAHNMRTAQLLDALVGAGHAVTLAAYNAPHLALSKAPSAFPGLRAVHSLPFRRARGWVAELQRIHDAADPECVVAINFDAALAATKLRTGRPMWMDLFGDQLTILQASRHRSRTNRGLITGIRFMTDVLRRGDVFSGCSRAQADALLGQLGMAARLNADTMDYPFVRIVRPSPLRIAPPASRGADRPHLATLGVPPDAVVLLWYGGFHPWVDADTLSSAVERAMEADDRVRVVVVGAGSHDIDDDPHACFISRVDASPNRHRVHLVGWKPWPEARALCAESDIGIHLDGDHAETRLGTRTRFVEMLELGLPIVTTEGCELSAILHAADAGVAVPSGDAEAFADAVIHLVRDDGERSRRSAAARRLAMEDLAVARTVAPLIDWVAAPTGAPDRRRDALPISTAEYRVRTATRRTIWRLFGLERG